MKGAAIHGAREVRFAERDAPKITQPTDADWFQKEPTVSLGT